jgi:hypothetical protein
LALFDPEKPILQNIVAAALIALVLDSAETNWNAYEEPVDFLIGAPNTGGSKPYRALARKHIGALDAGGAENLADTAKLESLAADIKAYVEAPKIQSVAGGDGQKQDFDPGSRLSVFRISSKRFTYDAYIMNLLTSPRVGTDEEPRNLPEGTDVMAVLGSPAAIEAAKENDEYRNYTKNFEQLCSELGGYFKEETVYSFWLGALRDGFTDSGSPQFFYRSPAWQWKKLSTMSASWAELKHDTILYTEQSGAEMGNGGDWRPGIFAPPQPRGYVEPDPQTYGALLAAVGRLKDFIERYWIADTAQGWDDTEGRGEFSRLESFEALLNIAKATAEKEVAGEILNAEDFDGIKRLSDSFVGGMLLPGDGAIIEDREQLKMALVADVATNYMAGQVLEAASGTPMRIYVFVNDASGGARITRGYTFSYYEFVRDLSEGRMTDEEWKKIVYDPSRAEELKQYHPDWYGRFMPDR